MVDAGVRLGVGVILNGGVGVAKCHMALFGTESTEIFVLRN